MKKYLTSLSISILALLSFAYIVQAQNPLPPGDENSSQATTNFNSQKQDLENTKETTENQKIQLIAEIDKTRSEAKQKIESLKANVGKIKNKAKAVTAQARILGREDALQRFDLAIAKVTDLSEKISAQTSKMEAKGQNVVTAKDQIASAQEKILTAQEKIAAASSLLAQSTDELTKDTKEQLKQLTEDAQSSIKDAHQTLSLTVQYLKTLNIAQVDPEVKD